MNSYTAVYKKTGKIYVAWIEEISGVHTQGKTLKEAKENLKDALSLILECNRMLNTPKSKTGIIRERLTVPA